VQTMNFLESSVVFRRATALFNQVQQHLAEEPRKWDTSEMAKALIRLSNYADIFTDLIGELNSRILSGEEVAAPKLMAAAQLLTNHVAVLRNGVQQGNTVLQHAYAQDASPEVRHTVQTSEGIAPARAEDPSN